MNTDTNVNTMGPKLPITLVGSNLQDRHRNLNMLVSQTYEADVTFQDIADQPEKSPIDRILKIDLAANYRNVQYIIKNLKDDDMLYVSRSLKCLWLLDSQHRDLINPLYLENTLYPEMIQPAVNKMKHWIQLHLKDKERCQEFYNYYKANFEEAFKYFWHCSKEFILSEFPNVIDKLSPKQLKIVLEVCPAACVLYFEILPNNRAALTKYVSDARNYFNAIKSILKFDGNLLLDIFEKYFDNNSFNCLGPYGTQYVMKYYRNRFDTKSELYASSFLHLKTLARNLSSDKAKELILRLANAEYLKYWFSYEKVEPLIKRLKPEERSCLKKQIFVDKTIDCTVKEWPYMTPKPLVVEDEDQAHVFTDKQHESYEYGNSHCGVGWRKCKRLTKRKCSHRQHCDIVCVGKSPLDQLFNLYRFSGFEQTFYELSKNLLAESTISGRLNMMLVLVSKSGGVAEQVNKFLKLMVERHRNEPSTLRAAVIRSLVKRGCAWRLPDNVWSLLLEFGRDIGLDGDKTDPLCREGLHAVVLRELLADRTLSPSLLSGFLREFCTFSKYKLNTEEIKIVVKRLPLLILPLDSNAFLDSLVQYKINIKDIPEAETALLKAAKGDSALVNRLYKAKILRRELYRETFALRNDCANYINALRHDTSLLANGKSFSELVAKERPSYDRFLKSLCVYFGESGGLAEQHRIFLEEAFLTNPKIWFPRSLCYLLSNDQLLHSISTYESKKPQSKGQLIMSTGLRSNAHKTKPPLDIDAFDWQWIGAKAVANKVFICRMNQREKYIKKLLTWRRTARISCRLSIMTPASVDTFIAFSSLRPLAAVKLAISSYLTQDYIEPRIWNAIKSALNNTHISQNRRLLNKLSDPKTVSKNVSADYWAVVFDVFLKIDEKEAMPILCRLENLLYDVDRSSVSVLVKRFIDIKLDPNKFSTNEDDDFDSTHVLCLYVRIIAKHLLLCKCEAEQQELIENICEPFFNAIEALLKTIEFKKNVIKLLNDFVISLKYTKIFLSDQYVHGLPVFERILTRMHKILPVEEHFDKYVEIHLTMLYYKTLKQVKKLKPGVLDEPNKRNEAIEFVGRIFGKYIGHEIKELVAKYFKSVVDLYKTTLNEYLREYFHFNSSRHLLVTFVVKGLLEADTEESSILAEYIFQKEQEYNIAEPHRTEIMKALKDTKHEEVKLFLYADVISVACAC